MAYAKICDRCGNVYAKNEYHADFGPNKYGVVKGACIMFEETDRRTGIQVDGIEPRKNAYFDLCDNCTKMLATFMQDKDSKIESHVNPRY